MKRPNITPGNWRQNSVAVQHDIHDVLSEEGATVAFIPGKGLRRKADGKAIAALPELLAALEALHAVGKEGVAMRHETGKPTWSALEETKKLTQAALIQAGYTFD